eukprot:scaffold940_cov262-Pinguiococcus_pyrenoidosus.AAC.5
MGETAAYEDIGSSPFVNDQPGAEGNSYAAYDSSTYKRSVVVLCARLLRFTSCCAHLVEAVQHQGSALCAFGRLDRGAGDGLRKGRRSSCITKPRRKRDSFASAVRSPSVSALSSRCCSCCASRPWQVRPPLPS